MSIEAATEYLGKLLNRPLAADSVLRLSSAQRARFNAWLHGRGLSVDDRALAAEFTLDALLGGAAVPTAVLPSPASAAAHGASETGTPGLAMGIDIQHVGELMQGLESRDYKANPELLRLFTLQEISYAQARPNPPETLAGIFAAKEAIRKCMGGGELSQQAFRAIEVLPDESGRPVARGYELSIAHSGGFAVAVACRLALPGAPAIPALPPPTATSVGRGGGTRWLSLALLASTLVLVSLHLALLVRGVR